MEEEDLELVSLIKGVENEKNKIKVIDPISIIKEIKHNNKKSPIKEIKEKPCFEQDDPTYFLLIQNVLDNESFYLSPKFDYNNYKINNEKIVQFTQFYKDLNTPSREVKYYDSPILGNHKVDEIMDKFKFAQMKGQVLGDYFIPENVNPDDFERFYFFKKLNPFLMILKYALNPL